jgi:hypothetical protein
MSATRTPRWLRKARPSSLSTAIGRFDAERRRPDAGRDPVKDIHIFDEKGMDIGSIHRV